MLAVQLQNTAPCQTMWRKSTLPQTKSAHNDCNTLRLNSDQIFPHYEYYLCTFALFICVHTHFIWSLWHLKGSTKLIIPTKSATQFYYWSFWILFQKFNLKNLQSAVITSRHEKGPHSNTFQSKTTPPEYWWRGKIRTRKQICRYYILLQVPLVGYMILLHE